MTGYANRGKKYRKHGAAKKGAMTREYIAWNAMKQRCANPHNKEYPNYGGRGISVCSEWIDDFPQFLADMGPKPGRSYTVDRIDNSRNYAKDNCRWATPKEQSRNNRRNRSITVNGVTRVVADWEKALGMHKGTFYQRLEAGWSEQDAASVPPRRRRKAGEVVER